MTEKQIIQQMAADLHRMRRWQTGERALWPLKVLVISCLPALLYKAFTIMKAAGWFEWFRF
jgi:hypothetical protein